MAETVQKQKQRIRGPKLEVFRRVSRGVSFPDALKLAEEAKRVLVSNKKHDTAIIHTYEWRSKFRSIMKGYPCWTGTITGYEEKNKKLEKEIVYVDPITEKRYIFPTGNAEGSKNVILVAEHPDYELVEDGKDLIVIVKESMVDILEDFPVSDGWYKTDGKHGIPTGMGTNSSNEEARHLWRIEGARVGPVQRDYNNSDYYLKHNVNLNNRPSFEFGVVVEAPERGVPKELRIKLEPKLRITEEPGKLIIEGTLEEIARIKELIKK